jgi:hemoglobin/transferrin/lactoferrin receptor protein
MKVHTKFLLTFCLLAPPIYAQDEAQILEEMVVTASRFEEPTSTVPNVVHIITSVDLEEKQFRTLPESFAETPGVLVQKTANGHGSPFIRGFTGFRNLLLVDGIRLNNSVFREGPNQYWNTIDAFSLDRIELIKGQGSVLWGSDAIGGTVNALSKSANVLDYADGELFANGRTHYRWSSAESSHTGRVEANVGEGGRYGLHLGYTQRQFGDLRSADIGRQPYTGYDEWALDAKFDYFFSPDTKLTIAYQQLQQDDIWRTHKTIHGVSWNGTTTGSELRRVLDQERRLAYAQLETENMDGPINRAKFSLSWHNQAEERDRLRSTRDVQGFDVDTLGTWAQFGSDTSIGDLTYGASFYRGKRGQTLFSSLFLILLVIGALILNDENRPPLTYEKDTRIFAR